MSIRSLLPLVFVGLVACSKDAAPTTAPATKQPTASIPASMRLDAAPLAASSVIDLRKSAVDGAEVVVTGRASKFIDTRASFTIVDMSLKSCAELGDKTHCPTPWDYCCEDLTTLTAGTTNIQVREGTEVAKGSVQGWNGLDHLKQVVVRGKLEKDDKGNLTVIANGIFVQP
ncbi:MAG: hypothetical protein ABI054_02235 [Planctomycetota bacterium]